MGFKSGFFKKGLLLLAVSALFAPHANAEEAYLQWSKRFSDVAGESGATVGVGEFRFFTVQDCLDLIQSIGGCLGNNASSPYGLYYLPPGKSEYIPRVPTLPSKNGLFPFWRLKPTEVVVFLGKTPPHAQYFGYRSYVQSRNIEGEQKVLAASLGDTLNHTNLHYIGSSPFSTSIAVVTSSDKVLEQKVTAMLQRAGVPAAVINYDRIPGDVVRLGQDSNADELFMATRMAVPTLPSAASQYVSKPPAVVLRIDFSKAGGSPFPEAVLAPREGVSEAALESTQLEIANSLSGVLFSKSKFSELPFLIGSYCLKLNFNCFGDNQDTTYSASAATVLGGASVLVVGVNHALTGNATYMNLTVNNISTALGMFSVLGKDLEDSVLPYLPLLRKELRESVMKRPNLFYVYRFARDCGNQKYCSEVPEGELGLQPGQQMRVVERSYLKPGTSKGPEYKAILSPYLIWKK